MKHTPGNWKWRQRRGNNIYEHIVEDSQRHIIAELNPPDEVKTSGQVEIAKQIQANARLIAAAPELLEACKHVLNNLTEMSEENFEHEITHLEYVINKAEGGE